MQYHGNQAIRLSQSQSIHARTLQLYSGQELVLRETVSTVLSVSVEVQDRLE